MTALISHTSKVMLKILQAKLQQFMNRELSDVQTRVLEKTLESPLDSKEIKPVNPAAAAAAAAKSLQSCPTLWDPIDGSPTGSPVPGIL